MAVDEGVSWSDKAGTGDETLAETDAIAVAATAGDAEGAGINGWETVAWAEGGT